MSNEFRKTDPSYPEPSFTENALVVLKERYLEKNEKGESLETPKDMLYRVAAFVASAEPLFKGDEAKWRRSYYDMMASREFLPNTPTLMNAGRNNNLLSACFVLPLEDSIDDIFDTVKETALIQKAGGGTGFSFDRLRPTGDYIASSGGFTSGPISFWKVLAESTNAIQQGAFRRGANMGMMSVTHPDILKFIHAKLDPLAFNNFNISVKLTDDWMAKFEGDPDSPHVVENFRSGKKYLIPREFSGLTVDRTPVTIHNYALNHLTPVEEGVVYDQSQYWSRKQVLGVIVDCAWKNGEPGLIFIDEINRHNPTPHIGAIEATNPCGEQPLLPHEACNLGSIDVSKFVSDGVFDTKRFKSIVYDAVRFLDDVIEVNPYPVPKITEICRANRKIGLGMMGFADLLIMMGIPYDSEEGVSMGRMLMKLLNDEAHKASASLAKERGNFANYVGSIYEGKGPMRNSATTTLAPTGTISILADCSSGMEPLFAFVFKRQIMQGHILYEMNKHFKLVAEAGGFSDLATSKKIGKDGTLAYMDNIPEDIKRVFVCAHDIAPKAHVDMQAAFQENCDSSISKTINFPQSATREDVLETYLYAWKMKCKGITVYRDKCRDVQPMSLIDEEVAEIAVEAATKIRGTSDFVTRRPAKTPDIASSVRVRQNTPFGHMHVNVTVDPKTNQEIEVFAQLGKAGDVLASDLEAISRLTSLYLRLGGDLADIIGQLEQIGSTSTVPTKEGNISSMSDALAKALTKYRNAKGKGLSNLLLGNLSPAELHQKPGIPKELKEKGEKPTQALKNSFAKGKCPECGSDLVFREGCTECGGQCGYSKCGG